MARQVITTLVDDLTGGEASKTFALTFQGVTYVLDLNDENSRTLLEALEPFLAVARRVPGARIGRRSRPSGPTPADVRSWARERGVAVPMRGRIPQAVRDAYEAAR